MVAAGDYARVLLFGEARKEYEALLDRNDRNSIQAKRTLQRYFERFAEKGPQSLDNEMFKKQGRENVGGTDVMVFGFKAYQFRIYGVVESYGGRRCFVGTSCDPAKKQNKADAKKLEKAAKEWVRLKNG
ncbi:hypothetical protein [Neorhizobium huautlense]|uniref:hypothetical protein n=1 Tax=Neorhizobium huautlense TaxID=67774 RepID=UPI0013005549|nr:hypothetical protein [Neorhizobium huautlense]